MASNLYSEKLPAVRQANVPQTLSYEDMSPLGQRLWDIAREIEASDEPGLDEAAIELELAQRRGGYQSDEGSHLP